MKYDCNFTEVIVIKKTFMKSWWQLRAGVKTFLQCHLFFLFPCRWIQNVWPLNIQSFGRCVNSAEMWFCSPLWKICIDFYIKTYILSYTHNFKDEYIYINKFYKCTSCCEVVIGVALESICGQDPLICCFMLLFFIKGLIPIVRFFIQHFNEAASTLQRIL